jgi:hypothetical protein
MRKTVYVLALALMVPLVAAAQTTWVVEKNLKEKGVVVEASCYHKLGIEKVNTAEHTACALDCVKKGQGLGIMTDDNGFLLITGNLAKDHYAKVVPFIGKRVAITGAMSRDAFSARFVEIATIVPSK